MGGVCFRAQDKVEAAADEDGGVDKGEEIREMAHVDPLLEPQLRQPHGRLAPLLHERSPPRFTLSSPSSFQDVRLTQI